MGIELNSQLDTSPGSYVVPINLTVAANGKVTNVNAFITVTIYNSTPSQASILNQISVLNYTNSTEGRVTSGTIQISSPLNSSIVNSSLETLLPGSLANNISEISTYGIPSAVSSENGSYVIHWQIPYLPPGEQAYAYYMISNSGGQAQLYRIQNLFTVPSQATPQLKQVLKIINISVPDFYANTLNHISVHALYAGIVPGQINFTMASSSGARIQNSTRIVNLTPNQYVVEDFGVEGGQQPGTMLLMLYISSKGMANMTYSLPVVVLPGTPATASTYPSLQGATHYIEYTVIAIAVLAIATAIYLIRRGRGRQLYGLYKPPRRTELQTVKEQIEEGEREGPKEGLMPQNQDCKTKTPSRRPAKPKT